MARRRRAGAQEPGAPPLVGYCVAAGALHDGPVYYEQEHRALLAGIEVLGARALGAWAIYADWLQERSWPEWLTEPVLRVAQCARAVNAGGVPCLRLVYEGTPGREEDGPIGVGIRHAGGWTYCGPLVGEVAAPAVLRQEIEGASLRDFRDNRWGWVMRMVQQT
jgi:hypothetical protein